MLSVTQCLVRHGDVFCARYMSHDNIIFKFGSGHAQENELQAWNKKRT